MENILYNNNGLTHLIELIRVCNENIIMLRERGEADDSLMVKQEKRLMQQYCNDLNALLIKYKVGFQAIVEFDRPLAQAA